MDFLFPDKKIPQMLSKQLRILIETIGETKNKQQEEQIISQEITNVKQQIIQGIPDSQLPDTLVKLIYFQTMGYNTSFAHILPINLCQSSSIYLKKMAYLLSAMIVRAGQGVGVLMHNTIMKDLQSDNVYIIMIALTMLRYFLTADLIPEVLPLVNKLRKHNLNIIRKKSFLVLLNIHQKYPHFIPDIKSLATQALNDSDPTVMFSGVSIMSNLIKADASKYKDMAKKLTQIQWDIVDHKYPHEYDYHKIPAPWIQIDIIKMFQELGKNDQHTSGILYEVIEKTLRRASNFPMNFNKSIMQQCIKTISKIYPHQYLMEQAQLSIGKFFETANNNMKYFGIVALTELAKSRKQSIDKWQMLLLECMESPDITLAERTLGLLVQIANQDNTTIILNKLITLTQKSTDSAQRTRLLQKALLLIQRFSENRDIFLRRMNEILYKFQSLISNHTINNFLNVLLEISQLDTDFPALALTTYIEIIINFSNPTLVKVSAWIIGELTHLLYLKDKDVELVDRSVDALLSATNQYINNRQITFMITTSLAKLATFTTRKEQIKEYWMKVRGSIDYFTHSIGDQMIRMAKYSKAFYNSSEIQFDNTMTFLTIYADQHPKTKKQYLFSKNKSNRKISYDILQSETLDETNIKQPNFTFKPGSRWGNTSYNKPPENKPIDNKNLQKLTNNSDEDQKKQRKKSFNLRGPHDKKTKNPIDEKKAKLAQSIFGVKKK